MTRKSSRNLKNLGLSGFYMMASWTAAITTLTPLHSDMGEGRSSDLRAELFLSNRATRRICPGRHFADESLYFTVASVLHVFDIGPPLDNGSGEPVVIKYEQTDGFLT